MILGVPCLRRYDLLDVLVESANRGSRRPDKILLVDNGGQYDHRHPGVEVIHQGQNLGVAVSWNRLLRAGAWIITNDDVTFRQNTFAEMAGALEDGDLFVSGDGWALFGQRPELAERVGFYDERFFPAYYEDTDYYVRLVEAGIQIRNNVLSEPIHHVQWGSAESVEKVNAICAKSYEIFIDKWGAPPDAVLARLRAAKTPSTESEP